MGDWDHIGKCVEPLFRMAIVGFFACVVLAILAIIGAVLGIVWLFHHVRFV